jgi:hypothetical protein
MATYYKIAGASEMGPSFTLSQNSEWAIGNARITGASAVLPINASGEASGTSGNAVSPSITTTVPNTLVLSFFGRNNSAVLSATGKVYQVDSDPVLSNMLAASTQAAIGVTGGKTATGSTADSWAAQEIAIAPATSTYTQGGQTFTFTVPNEIPAGLMIEVQAWGGGGAGGAGALQGQTRRSGGGGGGGGYQFQTYTVTPGLGIDVTVGAGGASSAGSGGNSQISFGVTTLTANGGVGGGNATTVGMGMGVSGTGGVGGTDGVYNGGTGASGQSSDGNGTGGFGGGGGGSGGTNANGNPGTGINGGVAVTGGGTGGNGSNVDGGMGMQGSSPGGGGGGGRGNNGLGGAGAPGRVIITYVCPAYTLASTTTTIPVPSGGGEATVKLEGNLPLGNYDITYKIDGADPAGTQTINVNVTTANEVEFQTVTLSSVTSGVEIEITNLSSGGVGGCSSDIDDNNTAILPITLITFEGRQAGAGIELEWRTGSELNNDYVAIERSFDGRAFDEIGRVPGQGDSNQPRAYAFRDDFPLPGINYYRLRQVDYDGTTEYHPVIAVAFEGQSRLGLRAFPNPVEDELRVVWTAPQGRAQTPFLRLLDANGRLLGEYPVAGNGGVYNLPAAELPAGLYVLQLLQGSEIEVVKVVKK